MTSTRSNAPPARIAGARGRRLERWSCAALLSTRALSACALATCAAIGSGAARAVTAEEATPPLDTITVVATGVSNMDAASAGGLRQGAPASQPLLPAAAPLGKEPGVRVKPTPRAGSEDKKYM